MEKKIKRERKIYLAIIIILGVLLIGVTYAWLRTTVKGEKKVSIIGDKLELLLDESQTEGLSILDGKPTPDEVGKANERSYHFILKKKGNIDVKYKIYLEDDEASYQECGNCKRLEHKNIRYELIKDEVHYVDGLSNGDIIDTGIIKGEQDIDYELRIWMHYDAGNEAQESVFYGKIRVEAIQNVEDEDETEPNAPVLADNMIPVKYDGYNWVTAENNKTWYNYEKQEWANAVVVTNDTRETYKNASIGTKIVMNDILMMYVWIPRYSYTIEQPYGKGGESAANPGEIDVKFISTGTKDKGTAQYTKSLAKEWYTPPGFTFGGKELSGIWVGKFETGSVTGTSPNDVDPETSKNLVAIKPNITSWRNIRVSTLEEVSMGITSVGNIYGFDQTTYDAHAAKNTEWALISYLTQSKYGKYGNSLYTGENKQVYMNNYSGYLTGCSSGKGIASSVEVCTYLYDDLTRQGEGTGFAGTGASTTGNIYGIYDINGGTWEYVMGNLSDPDKRSGNTQGENSGYTGKLKDGSTFEELEWKEDKHYDFYSTTSVSTACVIDGNKNSPCKGHALGEVSGWYGDFANMVNTINPWFVRGGNHNNGTYTGVFAFNSYCGSVYSYVSFRQVLTPNL